jgi:hypothetical protein
MITITAYNWVPDFAKGLVRDLRVRWALEEAGLPYQVKLITHEEKLTPSYRALQPFSQVPSYRDDDVVLFESGAIVLHIARTRACGRSIIPITTRRLSWIRTGTASRRSVTRRSKP